MSTERGAGRHTAGHGGLRVAFVTSIFPNPEDPTLGAFHEQIAAELSTRCELTVISPHPWFPRLPGPQALEPWLHYARIPRAWQLRGIPVVSPKYAMVPRLSESIRPLLMFPGLLRVMRGLHRSRGFDVIAGLWLYPDGVAAAWVAKWLGVPLVLVGLGCDVNVCLQQPVQAAQLLSAVRQAGEVIVVADNLKEQLCAAGVPPSKIEVIANGVDGERFRPRDRDECARALAMTGTGKRCVFVGRLAEEKGVGHLIAALHEVVRRGRDVTLSIVGDGPLRGEIATLVARLGLADRVRFVGAQSHENVATWIGASDLLCLPSLREGCPNVVLEALSSGRPVVASRVGGIPDIVDARNGALAEPADSADLANAVDAVLGARWDPEAIRASVGRRSWARVADRYYNVFQASACGGHASRVSVAPGTAGF